LASQLSFAFLSLTFSANTFNRICATDYSAAYTCVFLHKECFFIKSHYNLRAHLVLPQ
jgi:hypothetical protein